MMSLVLESYKSYFYFNHKMLFKSLINITINFIMVLACIKPPKGILMMRLNNIFIKTLS